MRAKRIGAIAFAVAGIVGVLIVTPTYASHGHETLAVNECQAYQFVLEANDQLYLCRYEAIELSHATASDDLGTAGILLVIEENSTPIELANIPRMGVGLAGVYFTGNDLFAPTFATTTVDVYLSQNPTFFPVPDESIHIDVTFNVSSNVLDTQELLTTSLGQMIFRIGF